jgi:hypothetical protein
MPIVLKSDKKGWFFQYGTHGKKYYFNYYSPLSRDKAYLKALKQARAIQANKNKKS